MNQVRIAAIVEGHGEVEAVPILIRRIVADINPAIVPVIPLPIRIPAGRLKKTGELERAINLATKIVEGQGGILILLDCDWKDGCPKTDGPILLHRAELARPDVPIALALAYREYESWFITAAESIRGHHGISTTLEVVANPEEIRGAKEWISQRMSPNRKYIETIDQPSLTQLFDLQQARRASSFDKCYREIRRLINILNN